MKLKPGFLFALLMTVFAHGFSQDSVGKRFQVAIFTPLFLDSAFDQTSSYRFGNSFPKYINSGLEFYEGAELAIDSLRNEGLPLDIHVYDSKSSKSAIATVLKDGRLDSIDLIIGHVNANEAKLLANAANSRNVPFINATYPNDAGVSDNPDFVILNSTLLTHCNAIYRFIQKNHGLSQVVLFTKKGAQEDRLRKYFEDISRNTASVPLKIKYVTLDGAFTPNDLRKHLNRDIPTVCIAGSLDVSFGTILTEQLASLYSDFPSLVFAMPTWWEATDFESPDFKDIEVFYSTPFYIAAEHPLVDRITDNFKTKFYSRPTDMVFKGYETLYHFAHLLHLNGKNLGSSLSDKRFNVFTDFDIQPVINPKTNTLDYFENKKIYFVKKVQGEVTGVF